MLGWILIFALMFLTSVVLAVTGGPGADSPATTTAAIISGALFLACILTRMARIRT